MAVAAQAEPRGREEIADRGLQSLAPSLVPSLLVWALFGLWLVMVFVTYARLPAEELYKVSGSGLMGGASRGLVLLGYPLALGSILILGFVWERVRRSGAVSERRRRAIGALALVGVVLCATVGIPSVVDPDNLDAKPLNALAAVGVLLAFVLTVWTVRLSGLGNAGRWTRGDSLRSVMAFVLLLVATPWVGAVLGFHLRGLPVLGEVFLSGELRTQPGEPIPRAAVHLGDHEGLDGLLLVAAVLILTRELRRMRGSALRTALIFTSSLALVYGLAVVLADFWLEQIVKRGWTDFEITGVLEPGPTVGWAGILIVTGLLGAIAVRYSRRESPVR